MVLMSKSKEDNKQVAENVSEIQKNQAYAIAKYGTQEQQLDFLSKDNIGILLKIKCDGEPIYKILAESKPTAVKFKLLDTITSKSPDLLEKVAPIFIKKARELAGKWEYFSDKRKDDPSKEIIEKVWECIKKADNPADPKILNSEITYRGGDYKEKEKLAYYLFESQNGLSLVPDFLDWLKDPSVLKAYKKEKEVTKSAPDYNYYKDRYDQYKYVDKSTYYLVNYIADNGDDKERLDLLNTIDRLKAYDLFLTKDKTKSATRHVFSPIKSKDKDYEAFYSIMVTKGGEEAISKFLDILDKMDDNEALIKSKFKDIYDARFKVKLKNGHYTGAHYDVDGFASLLAARMLHDLDINTEMTVKPDYLMALAEKYPSILGSRIWDGHYGFDDEYTVADILAKIGGEEIQNKLLKFIEIPGLMEPITKAINNYGTEEFKKEVQKILLGPFKLRV